MRTGKLSIPGRFNGPLDSGNGGYCSGALAGLLPEGAAEVTLRRPVPLDTPLEVQQDDGAVRLVDREALVAEARPASAVDVEVPAPVSPAQARSAAAGYRGRRDGPFSRCFVCGLAREDAFGVFAGAVEERGLVASTWTPPPWTAGPEGEVRPEFVWAVLDCPTYFAAYLDEELRMGVLAQMSARVEAPVAPDREHVVIAWPIEADGRKRHAGSAVLSSEGRLLAIGRVLLIEPRQA